MEDFESPAAYRHLTATLRCDFLTLTYLMKNAANVNQGYAQEERLLILYFKVMYVSLVACHWLGFSKTAALLKLTGILQYFANVVGERVNTARFHNLAPSDYLSNI
jgi:hypothetical protein